MGKAKKAPASEKRQRGRPSLRSPEIEAEIVERLSKGEPMAVICRDEHMPSYWTVRNWAEADSVFSQAIARARELGFDEIAAETLEIADNAKNDWMAANDDSDAAYRLNGEHIQRSKLRIETRLKLLAKWDPKRYGDKLQTELSGPDGGPIQTRNLDDETLKARIAELTAKFAASGQP